MEPLEEPGDITAVHKGITELEPYEEPGDIMGIKEVKKKGKIFIFLRGLQVHTKKL